MDDVGCELLTRLLDEHGPRLVLYAQQWCSSPEDVVQEAFIRLMRERTPPAHPTAWLYRVVRNLAISASRSADRRTRHEDAAARRRSQWFELNALDQLDSQTVAMSLDALPIAVRETVVLRVWSELSFEQIAELTETSLSTAHRRYGEGLEMLRAVLGISLSE
jgi:RNA polymerase sigma-70 factor (ECF subfamily)